MKYEGTYIRVEREEHVSIRQHTSADVTCIGRAALVGAAAIRQPARGYQKSAYVRIRQHTSAYVRIPCDSASEQAFSRVLTLLALLVQKYKYGRLLTDEARAARDE